MNLKLASKLALLPSLALALLPLLGGCGNGKGLQAPAAAFIDYVYAYTGGTISQDSSIRIDFASDVDSSVDPDALFSFSPSLKGSAHWVSASRIEFIPESGALKQGATYKATFRLGDVVRVSEKSLKKFDFSFRVARRQFSVSGLSLFIDPSEPEFYQLEGKIQFSEPVEAADASDIISVKCHGAAPSVEVLPGGGTSLGFTVSGIAIPDSPSQLKLSVDASSLGYKDGYSQQVALPPTSEFGVISAELVEDGDCYADIRFSGLLDDSRDYKGLIYTDAEGRSYMDVKGNRVKLFFERGSASDVRLTVSSLLKNADGKALGQEYTKTFRREDIAPAVKLAFTGSILPDAAEVVLPLRAVNLSAVDVSIIKVYANNMLMYLQDNSRLSDGNDIRRSGRMVYKGTVRLDSDPGKDLHKWQDFSIDLSPFFKKEPGALYRITLSFRREYSLYGGALATDSGLSAMVSPSQGSLTEEDEKVWDRPNAYYYDNYYDWELYDWDDRDDPTTPSYYMISERFPKCSLLASDVGIIVKSAGAGDYWVTANELATTEPLSFAEVTAYSYQLQEVASAKTDGKGFAHLRTSVKPFVFTVRKDDRIGYLRTVDGEEKSLSRFDVGGQELSSGMKAYIYGERGVWRPGDTLHVSAMIEDRGKAVPRHHPVTMELYTPQGQFYSKQVNTSGVNGLYVFDIPTRESDPTGTWNAYVKVGGASFHKALPVETVKANRLKVNVELSDEIIQAGGVTRFDVSSNWLTGPAASGLKVVSTMTLSRRKAAFSGYEGYNFQNPISSYDTADWDVYTTTLDNSGRARVSVKISEVPSAPGMMNANIVTRVMEPGGDASIATCTELFSPFRSYVGVKLPSEWQETDTDLNFPIVVLDSRGRPVSGDRLEYRIYKMDWSWWWESRRESLSSYVNGKSSVPVSQGTLTSSTSPATVPFRLEYPEWGRFLLYVKDLDSGHASGGIFYVDWPSWRGRSEKNDPSSLTMLSFSLDRGECKVGDEVTVYIPAAKAGRALVSLENGRGVISRNWVKTDEERDTRHVIKVTEDMAPNFYVHVTMLQSREDAGNDLPVRMYGVQPVLVQNPDARLEPVLSLPDVIRPQEEFSVKVREKKGRPMTYTLAVVDEGLLDLTAFRTPDPYSAMYAREALGVKTWDLYDDVFGAFSGKFSPLAGIGGDDEIVSGARKDNRFNPVVRFYGPFELNRGEKVHKIKLPMYVGSVRVMLVAGQDGSYGNAEKTVPVRSPLMLLPTLPRTIAAGDKVTLPVNVFAMEDDMKNVRVSVKAEGPVEIQGSASEALDFARPGDAMARFALAATGGTGTAKITVSAECGSYRTSETISVAVVHPLPATTRTLAYLLAPGESKTVTFTPFVPDGENRAQITLSNFPSVDFNSLCYFASGYQYSCSEQLAARGMALIYSRPYLSEDNAERADAQIPLILQELYSRQLADGGIAYWPGMSYANEWATSMTGQFLAAAAERGFSVNKGVLSSWKRFQKKCVSNYRHGEQYAQYDLQQAYRLYVLALAGAADEGAMNRLKSAPAMTPQACRRLAAAYAVCGKKNIAAQLISSCTADASEQASYTYTFGNSLRDKAMLLETEVLTDNLTAALPLAREVAEQMSDGLYGTQAAAFAALAFSRLAEKVGSSAIDVSVNGGSVRSTESSVCRDIDPTCGTLSIKNEASDAVYAVFLLHGYPAVGESVSSRSSNISLSVRYTDVNGDVVDPANLRQGTDFYAEYLVTNLSASAANRSNLALTVKVPSGWEIFNERLYGASSDQSGEYSYQDIRDDRVIWYFDLPVGTRKRMKLRLQAAYEGVYALPSAVCEDMYDSQTYACTASGAVRVQR